MRKVLFFFGILNDADAEFMLSVGRRVDLKPGESLICEGQQLQNLTALSWQGVEVVAGKGGSLEKFVFIQRGDQLFSQGFGERLRKTIKNIEGMEVVGFEVQESEAKRATPAGQQ